MKLFYAFLLICICYSCGGVKSGKSDSATKEFQIDTTKFKFRNLHSFDASRLYKDKIIDKLIAMDSVEKNQLLDLSEAGFIEECYFYSMQDSKNGYRVFTFIINYENCCVEIVYNVFKNNKLVYSFIISDSSYSEAGNTSTIKSQFTNADTLLYYHVTIDSPNEWPEGQKYVTVSIDSIAQKYELMSNYQFKKVYEQEIKREEKKLTSEMK